MYSFDLIRSLDSKATTVQVVYPSHEASDDHLASSLEKIVEQYNRRLVPSRLLFVCPSGVEQVIREWFASKVDLVEDRLVTVSNITVAPYDFKGRLISDDLFHVRPKSSEWNISDEFLVDVALEGVSELFNKLQIILQAPHGYVFRKPSSREKDIFVRAGNMLREPGCLPIFNHLLLRKLPTNCEVVYIDSFTILSFAMSVQSVVSHFRQSAPCLPTITIEDIHSYEIEDSFRIPNEENYLVLISASTSGGLSRKLVDKHQADRNRIIHLLGVGPPQANFKDSCIYFKSRETNPNEVGARNHAYSTIEIGTEEFLVAQGKPRPVRITIDHVNENGASELSNPFYQTALKFGEPNSFGPGSYSPFSICNEPNALTSSPVKEWVRDRLIHDLPASVGTLVYADDQMSKQVVEWIKDLLGSSVVVKSLEQVEKEAPASAPDLGAYVVVSYQDPGLERLTRASIALRNLGEVHRHYVVCYAFPPSGAEYKRSKKDLRRSRPSREYGWSGFLVLPIGEANLHDSLASQRKPYKAEALQSRAHLLGDQLAQALLDWVKPGQIPCNGLFLPSTQGSPLELRHGSIFFPNGTVKDIISHVAVYAMVSAAFQLAREPQQLGSSNGTPEFNFDDNPFVRSVLDPRMFTRFSDGILQASMLRATHPSELDYSASHELSRRFALICTSALVNHENPVGEAAIEFVYALATEKVSLRPKDKGRVLKEVESRPVLNAVFELFRMTAPEL